MQVHISVCDRLCDDIPRAILPVLRQSTKNEGEAILYKRLFVISIGIAFTSAAVAGEHYVETWNPPEVRSNAHELARQANKPAKPKRPPKSTNKSPRPAKQRISAAAAGREKTAPMARTPKRLSTFDSIPRQITPEGNILRVMHAAAPMSR